MAQSLSRLWTHLIFSTKNRFPFLTDKMLRGEMHAYLAEMLRNQNCETLIVWRGGGPYPFTIRSSSNLANRARGEGSQKNILWLDQRCMAEASEVSLARRLCRVFGKSVES